MEKTFVSAEALKIEQRKAVLAVIFMVLLTVGIIMIFRVFPQWDRWPTGLFFEPQNCKADALAGMTCGVFPLLEDQTFRLLRRIGLRIPTLALVALALYLLIMRFVKGWGNGRDLRVPFWGFLSGILATVVIANWTLKDNWGRPRPLRTLDFGGTNPYVPPGDISSYCDLNCSFVSGEATAAFWLVWFIVFLVGFKRLFAAIALLIFAIGVSAMRVAFGAHYISDVLVGGCVAGLSIALVYWVMHTKPVAAWLHRDSLRF